MMLQGKPFTRQTNNKYTKHKEEEGGDQEDLHEDNEYNENSAASFREVCAGEDSDKDMTDIATSVR